MGPAPFYSSCMQGFLAPLILFAHACNRPIYSQTFQKGGVNFSVSVVEPPLV